MLCWPRAGITHTNCNINVTLTIFSSGDCGLEGIARHALCTTGEVVKLVGASGSSVLESLGMLSPESSTLKYSASKSCIDKTTKYS